MIMKTSLCILLLLVGFAQYIYCYECETQHYNDGQDGVIQSPGFPAPFPDGPYNCTYIITNPNGGSVLLEFTDYVTHSDLNYRLRCREKLSIIGQREVCGRISIYDNSIGDTKIVMFTVNGENLHQLPGFKANFSMVPDSRLLSPYSFHGSINLETVPYKAVYGPAHTESPLDNCSCSVIDVVKAFPGYRVAWSLAASDDAMNQIGSEFRLEVRDGPTSMSPLIAEWTDIAEVHNVYSESEYLYFKFTKNFQSYTVPGSYAFFKEADPCPDGFFRCVNSGYCIGLSAVCDGVDHCGDNSDEDMDCYEFGGPDLCRGRFQCVPDNTYQCWRSSCSCRSGYEGSQCEYEAACPFTCENGGTCYENRCHCSYSFLGDRCEQPRVCDPPCRNNATCGVFDICDCTSDYYGIQCEYRYKEKTPDDHDKSLTRIEIAIVIFVPLIVIVTSVIACVIILSRRASRQNNPDSQLISYTTAVSGTTNISIPIRSDTAVSGTTNAGIPIRSDTPPTNDEFVDGVPAHTMGNGVITADPGDKREPPPEQPTPTPPMSQSDAGPENENTSAPIVNENESGAKSDAPGHGSEEMGDEQDVATKKLE